MKKIFFKKVTKVRFELVTASFIGEHASTAPRKQRCWSSMFWDNKQPLPVHLLFWSTSLLVQQFIVNEIKGKSDIAWQWIYCFCSQYHLRFLLLLHCSCRVIIIHNVCLFVSPETQQQKESPQRITSQSVNGYVTMLTLQVQVSIIKCILPRCSFIYCSFLYYSFNNLENV